MISGMLLFFPLIFGSMIFCRVTVATWNVAGRIPNEDLEINDWLCTDDPGDIYIIG